MLTAGLGTRRAKGIGKTRSGTTESFDGSNGRKTQMKAHDRKPRAHLRAPALAALFVAHGAMAAGEAIDEVVVYGTPTRLAVDAATLRVDTKQHARSIGRSVRLALGERSPEPPGAPAERRPPG
jgi:hypothetical protein